MIVIFNMLLNARNLDPLIKSTADLGKFCPLNPHKGGGAGGENRLRYSVYI